MTSQFAKAGRRALVCGAAVAAILTATPVFAQEQLANIDIAAQPMDAALKELAKQSGANLLFSPDAVRGLRAKSLQTTATAEDAARMLLAGTDLFVKKDATGSLLVDRADPQSGSAAGDGADAGTVAALVVTAQKREENIQDVPIAISAFTEKSLQEQKIEGGFDLLKAIPNVTFSKNNFSSYNFSIRGVGTKAVSATTDPGVAVSFNNTTLIQNRLFEQEYFDVERVEVLRGPQGTLYGRNATAGVINVISAKPNLEEFSGWLKGEVGNYHAKRISAMVNLPLVESKLAIRFAGALTDRQGYDYNSVTHNHVNGRDLWSGRVTVAFNPTERIRSNLIWERFNEDDNRSRTGKQLCHRDPGRTMLGDTSVVQDPTNPFWSELAPATYSQGCLPGSLYEDAAFGTPNGLALPFVYGMLYLGGDCGPECTSLFPLGYDKNGRAQTLLQVKDPYNGLMQSRNLRTIASLRDPVYRASADVVQFNVDVDIYDNLKLSSSTVYDKDNVYSFQDFNRFNTQPIFTDTEQLLDSFGTGPAYFHHLAPGGYFCDPQIGCSNTLAGFDVSSASSRQFTQEVRLQSTSDGTVNFSIGVNYTKFDALVDYYVFYNLITAYAQMRPFNSAFFDGDDYQVDPRYCTGGGLFAQLPRVPSEDASSTCPYIDPHPIESINGEGHNYFRSKNPYSLRSESAFGELYWEMRDDVKITAGLRYTSDRKRFVPVPSQVLLAPGIAAGGVVSSGYPELPPIKQHWGEWTGRLGVDWRSKTPITDETMVYAFYSRGYKGGGANPPSPGFATTEQSVQQILGEPGVPPVIVDLYRTLGVFPILQLNSAEYGPTFEPEFVNAFEIGAKNTFLSGALTLNGSLFLYDYSDYQVSQIRDRTAVNENFDAKIWGAELEGAFAPTRELRLVFNLGYLDTRIAEGESSIDIMNRTQSDPKFVVVKPWVQLPSNCVVPLAVAANYIGEPYFMLCGAGGLLAGANLGREPIDPATNQRYDPALYPEINGGAGIKAQLGGNELPNSPHWTMNIGAQYGHEILDGQWRATVRADAYWQSQSWARVYNDNPYDKLHGWYNVNLSVWFEKPDDDLKIELYAKNLLDKTPITDAFLNSDDTALTTNVFVLDPRLIGLSIKRGF